MSACADASGSGGAGGEVGQGVDPPSECAGEDQEDLGPQPVIIPDIDVRQ